MGEMRRTERSSPEAAARLARSIIETALTGSFLALHRYDAAQRLINKQSRPAKRIRDRFLGGDTLAALALLSEVSYLTGPLSSDLGTVKEAPDFDQALSTLKQTGIDVMILDVRLPGRSGLELLEHLRTADHRDMADVFQVGRDRLGNPGADPIVGGIAGAAAGIAKILFFGFLIVAAIALIANLTRRTI